MITSAAFLFSLQFLFNNGYQKESGSGWRSSLKFAFYSSIAGLFVLLCINRFHLELTGFSLAAAFVYGLVNVGSSYSSVKAFESANLSVYSVFSMIGGMLLPFVYGILCGEELTIMRLACCVLITLSVLISIEKDDQYKKAVKYYIAVFFLNGMAGVISKFHQSYPALCVDSGSFMMLTKITTIFLSVLLLLVRKERDFKVTGKAFAFCSGHSVFNSVGNLMLLIALFHLPASVQYPIVTGGVIVFSTGIDLVRKVKVTKKELVAAGIAFWATVLMAL